MAAEIKLSRLNFHCRTCLIEMDEEKFKLNELPDPLYELLLQCIGPDGIPIQNHPEYICEHCYTTIESFDKLQSQSKKSNNILRGLLGSMQIVNEEENETNDPSLCANEKLADPLNTNFEIKDELDTESYSMEESSVIESAENIEAEVIKAEPDIVFFSTSDQAEEIICKYGCGKTFQRISSLKAHHRIKHKRQLNDEGMSSSKKRKIESESDTSYSPSDDEDWKEPVNEKKFTCKICHKKYVDRSTLNTHKRLHQSKRPFQCEICLRNFNKKIRLTKHIKEMHSTAPLELKCKYGCEKSFNRYHALDKHHYQHRNNLLDAAGELIKSNDDKPNAERKESLQQDAFICEDCGKVLPNVTKLREHSYQHRPPEERPFKCEHCQKTFIVKRSYEEHLLRHAGIKNFSCEVCGLKTATRREVVKHMSVHAETKVSCTICHKVYADAKSLKRHVEMVHQKLRKYNCRYCEATFAKCDIRNRHEMEHGAERPYKCKLCFESFFLISKLSAHESSIHNIKISL